MERKYLTLFNLTVKHNYYNSGNANDFVFNPTSKTAKDMQRYKLLARPKNGKSGHPEAFGFRTSYLKVDGSPLIPITPTDKPSLVFGMNLVNDRFLNFTEEMISRPRGEVFYYTNVGAGAAVSNVIDLVGTTIKLRRKTFEYNFSIPLVGSPPVVATVKILDSAGAEIVAYQKILESEDGKFQALINLTGLDDGIYSVRILKGATIVQTTKFYISDELTAMNPLAIIDLTLDSNTSVTNDELRIQFNARSVKWRYFVVYKKGIAALGAGALTLGRTLPTPINFTLTTPAASTYEEETLNSLKEKFPSPSDVQFYESVPSMLFSETPTTGIQLKFDSTTLVKHLPGMPIENSKAEAYIFI